LAQIQEKLDSAAADDFLLADWRSDEAAAKQGLEEKAAEFVGRAQGFTRRRNFQVPLAATKKGEKSRLTILSQ
jgi:hypothetical protein